MFKNYRLVWLMISAVGLVGLVYLMVDGYKNGSMSNLFFSFGIEAIGAFIVIVLYAADESRTINHKGFNGLLLLSFLVAGFMFLVGYTNGLFIFVSANLAIYIFYLFFRNRLLKIELRKKNETLKIHNLVLQNYRERHV